MERTAKLNWKRCLGALISLVMVLTMIPWTAPLDVHAKDFNYVNEDDGGCQYCGEAGYCCEECGICADCAELWHCPDCQKCIWNEGDYCGEPDCRRCTDCIPSGYYEGYCADCRRCFEHYDGSNWCYFCERCDGCTGNEFCSKCEICDGDKCPGCGDHPTESHNYLYCKSCEYCADCVDVCVKCEEACTDCADAFCDTCQLCIDCAEFICIDCNNVCMSCDEFSMCGGCYEYCFDCGDVCQDCWSACIGCGEVCDNCGICSGCADEFCLGCAAYCSACVDSDLVEYCPGCSDYCLDCVDLCASCESYCEECAGLCSGCGECGWCVVICQICESICMDCATEFCEGCEYYCGDCATICGGCGMGCEYCAEVCPDCGDICSECDGVCFDCGRCAVCCAASTCKKVNISACGNCGQMGGFICGTGRASGLNDCCCSKCGIVCKNENGGYGCWCEKAIIAVFGSADLWKVCSVKGDMCNECDFGASHIPLSDCGACSDCTGMAWWLTDFKYRNDHDNHWLFCKHCYRTDYSAPHSFGAPVVTRPPESWRPGRQKLTCTVCDYSKFEDIPRLTACQTCGSYDGTECNGGHEGLYHCTECTTVRVCKVDFECSALSIVDVCASKDGCITWNFGRTSVVGGCLWKPADPPGKMYFCEFGCESCIRCAKTACEDCGMCSECAKTDFFCPYCGDHVECTGAFKSGEFCQNCFSCDDCAWICENYDGCDKCSNYCYHGMHCEDCSGYPICTDCGEICALCAVKAWIDWTGFSEGAWCDGCDTCGFCSGNACGNCWEACSSCSDMCPDCDYMCKACCAVNDCGCGCEISGACPNCGDATGIICIGCGYYCSSCEMICEGCGLCALNCVSFCDGCIAADEPWCIDCRNADGQANCLWCYYCENHAQICLNCYDNCDNCATICYDCDMCEICCEIEACDCGCCDPGHTHSFDPGWVFDDTNHWHECCCGEKSTVAAHIEDGGTVTLAPTATATGVRTFVCTVCGKTLRTEVIPATGGDGDTGPGTPPGDDAGSGTPPGGDTGPETPPGSSDSGNTIEPDGGGYTEIDPDGTPLGEWTSDDDDDDDDDDGEWVFDSYPARDNPQTGDYGLADFGTGAESGGNADMSLRLLLSGLVFAGFIVFRVVRRRHKDSALE